MVAPRGAPGATGLIHSDEKRGGGKVSKVIVGSADNYQGGKAGLPAVAFVEAAVAVGAVVAAEVVVATVVDKDAAEVPVVGLRSVTPAGLIGNQSSITRGIIANHNVRTGDQLQRPATPMLPLRPDRPNQGTVSRLSHSQE